MKVESKFTEQETEQRRADRDNDGPKQQSNVALANLQRNPLRYPLNSSTCPKTSINPHSNPLTRGQNRHAGFTRQLGGGEEHRHGAGAPSRAATYKGVAWGGPRTEFVTLVRLRAKLDPSGTARFTTC
nr:hypothetical protein Iba_chr02aCG21970 [Ipomoea batatas]GMC63888.1 hypothetical protein Iba_chr02cCG17510 [Ipomoea batatas]